MNKTLELLKSHYSVRKYKQEPISQETLHEMINAAQHAAASNFAQAYSVIQLTDPEKIEQVAKLSKNEPQIMSAPVVLLFCVDMKRLDHANQKHGTEINADTTENLLVGTVDTALFAQNFVVAAESLGYGICYIGGVRNNPKEIGEVVNLPDRVFPLFGMTVGVPDEEQQVKPRLPLKAILHENTYDEEKYESVLDEYDQKISKYYQSRLTNQKDTTWTKTMSDFLGDPRRLYMKEYLQSKGFMKR